MSSAGSHIEALK